jgi:hypothetical protein
MTVEGSPQQIEVTSRKEPANANQCVGWCEANQGLGIAGGFTQD